MALLLAGLPAALASDYQQRQQELKTLRAEIGRIEADLQRSRQQRDSVSRDVEIAEQAISRSARRLRELGGERRANTHRIQELQARRDAREEAVGEQRAYLVQELRSAYMQGRQHYLKLLLNQDDPATLERMLVYFESMGQARNRRIQAALEDLQELAAVRRQLDDERGRLLSLEEQEKKQSAELQARRDERSRMLASLVDAMRSGEGQLQRLAEDEAQVEQLLNKLRTAIADIPEDKAERPSFAAQRGKLAWPVQGSLSARFGANRGLGDGETWRGILFGADQGETVRAVAQGRIVFANWLRGLGLLLIIDHGNGHMTLYGHNDSLYKDVGDWVDAGEAIGSVGDTGGTDRAGLYFELRVGGKPQDPMTWLRSEPGRGS